MKIIIEKLPHQERSGDWHDKPLRWRVAGPGSEAQKFSTKKEARSYKSIRQSSTEDKIAIRAYSMTF
jgi:hypothetical protein